MTPRASGRAQLVIAISAGVLFGLGLAISQMINPAKVLAFLDVAGRWDPTLAFVMFGALAVTFPAFRIVLKRSAPWLVERFSLPTRKDLDLRLIMGAALFGVGWGLVGLCPGPALTALVTGDARIVVFVAAMIAGAVMYHALDARLPKS